MRLVSDKKEMRDASAEAEKKLDEVGVEMYLIKTLRETTCKQIEAFGVEMYLIQKHPVQDAVKGTPGACASA